KPAARKQNRAPRQSGSEYRGMLARSALHDPRSVVDSREQTRARPITCSTGIAPMPAIQGFARLNSVRRTTARPRLHTAMLGALVLAGGCVGLDETEYGGTEALLQVGSHQIDNDS